MSMMPAPVQIYSNSAANDTSAYLHVLVALIPEVERLCVLSGFCCTISKSLAEGRTDVQARALIKFFPRDSASTIIAVNRLKRWHPSSRLAVLIGYSLHRVGEAKQTTIEFAANGFGENADDLQLLQKLENTWTNSCVALSELLQYVMNERSRLSISGTDSSDVELLDFLTKIISGFTENVLVNGEISIPSWAEHRKSNRLSVRTPIRIIVDGKIQSVMLRDISCGGIGIDCVTGLEVGDRVIIVISDRNTIEGDVVWVESGRAGLTTESHIRSFHPLLNFALSGTPGS